MNVLCRPFCFARAGSENPRRSACSLGVVISLWPVSVAISCPHTRAWIASVDVGQRVQTCSNRLAPPNQAAVVRRHDPILRSQSNPKQHARGRTIRSQRRVQLCLAQLQRKVREEDRTAGPAVSLAAGRGSAGRGRDDGQVQEGRDDQDVAVHCVAVASSLHPA